jgi:hypothetical protein
MNDNLEPIRRVFRSAGLYHHAADDLLCGELAAAVQPQAEPVGEWMMVPREPTLAMLGAGRAKARDGYTLEAAWEAMLAAAPDRGGA